MVGLKYVPGPQCIVYGVPLEHMMYLVQSPGYGSRTLYVRGSSVGHVGVHVVLLGAWLVAVVGLAVDGVHVVVLGAWLVVVGVVGLAVDGVVVVAGNSVVVVAVTGASVVVTSVRVVDDAETVEVLLENRTVKRQLLDQRSATQTTNLKL